MAFWKDINTVLQHQYARTVEKRKQAVLQKHLQHLIGETEKYSSALALGLTGADADELEPPRKRPALDTAHTTPLSTAAPPTPDIPRPSHEEAIADASEAAPACETSIRSGDGVDIAEPEEGGSGGEEWVAGEGDEDADDERTLEEEERLARVEGGRGGDETASLEREAELPIEEIMKRYYGTEATKESGGEAGVKEEGEREVGVKEEGGTEGERGSVEEQGQVDRAVLKAQQALREAGEGGAAMAGKGQLDPSAVLGEMPFMSE